MSIYKDFIFLSSGIVIGIYIGKSDENSITRKKYDDLMYKAKPIIRDIRDHLLEFVNISNVNIDTKEIQINVENFLDVLKSKVNEINTINDADEKIAFIQNEIISLLNSIKTALKNEKESLEETLSLNIKDLEKE